MTDDERSDLLDRWYVQRLDELLSQTPDHLRAEVKAQAGDVKSPLGLRLRDAAEEDVRRVVQRGEAIRGRQRGLFG